MRTGSFELPSGLLSITMALFSIAVVKLFTKQVATVSGVAFTLALYVVFAISERTAARLFHDYEQMPFTKLVAVAKREGARRETAWPASAALSISRRCCAGAEPTA